MEIGRISKRYANALFLYAQEKNEDTKVYEDMSAIAKSFAQMPEIKHLLSTPTLSDAEKEKILVASVGEKVSDTTKDFLKFIVKKGKEEYIHFVSMSYQNLYRKANNIVFAEVTFCQEVDKNTLAKITTFIENKFVGKKVQLNVKTDSNIIGGFVLDVDNERLDASVLGNLNTVRRTLK